MNELQRIQEARDKLPIWSSFSTLSVHFDSGGWKIYFYHDVTKDHRITEFESIEEFEQWAESFTSGHREILFRKFDI